MFNIFICITTITINYLSLYLMNGMWLIFEVVWFGYLYLHDVHNWIIWILKTHKDLALNLARSWSCVNDMIICMELSKWIVSLFIMYYYDKNNTSGIWCVKKKIKNVWKYWFEVKQHMYIFDGGIDGIYIVYKRQIYSLVIYYNL